MVIVVFKNKDSSQRYRFNFVAYEPNEVEANLDRLKELASEALPDVNKDFWNTCEYEVYPE